MIRNRMVPLLYTHGVELRKHGAVRFLVSCTQPRAVPGQPKGATPCDGRQHQRRGSASASAATTGAAKVDRYEGHECSTLIACLVQSPSRRCRVLAIATSIG